MNITISILLIITIFTVIAYFSLKPKKPKKQGFEWNEKQIIELKLFLNENFEDIDIDLLTLQNKIKDNFSYDTFMERTNRIDNVKEDKTGSLRLNNEDIKFLYEFTQILDSIKNQPMKGQDYIKILNLDPDKKQYDKCWLSNINLQTKYTLATFIMLKTLLDKGFYNDNKIIRDFAEYITSFAATCTKSIS
jgi:hypothetical protein